MRIMATVAGLAVVVRGVAFRGAAPARRCGVRAMQSGAAWETVLEAEPGDVGRCVGVRLPTTREGVVEAATWPDPGSRLAEELAEEELAYPVARGFSVAAARDFWGGRLALRRALGGALGRGAILKGADGAPDLPKHLLGSISHKRPVAVAVARENDADDAASPTTVGVDLELAAPSSVGGARLARRILRDDERDAYDALVGVVPDEHRASLFFSIKEAVYKAIAVDAPKVAFKEVALGPFLDDATCVVTVADHLLPAGATVEASWRTVTLAAVEPQTRGAGGRKAHADDDGGGAAFFLSTAAYRRRR